jgi:hypothetical protein
MNIVFRLDIVFRLVLKRKLFQSLRMGERLISARMPNI